MLYYTQPQNINYDKQVIEEKAIEINAEHAERESYPFNQWDSSVRMMSPTASTFGILQNPLE